MSRLRPWLIAAGLALLSTSVFVCQRVADRGRFAVAHSSYGAGPEGVRGAFLLAQELGAKPERWAEDLARLPKAGGMLIALGDCKHGMARDVSPLEAAELRAWIEGGGVLLVAGARAYLPDDFPIALENDARCEHAEDDEDDEEGTDHGERGDAAGASGAPARGASAPESGDAGARQAAGDAAQAAGPAPDAGAPAVAANGEPQAPTGKSMLAAYADSALLGDVVAVGDPLRGMPPFFLQDAARVSVERYGTVLLERHEPVVGVPGAIANDSVGAVAPLGRGYVIALGSASSLQNRGLLQDQGGALLARLLDRYAPAGPVMFDEYHLGLGERRSAMRYLRQAGATPYVLQLLLVAVLLLWRAGSPFGGVIGPKEPLPGGTASFVAALGALFGRAKDPTGTAQILARQALARIAAYHHLRGLSGQRLAEQLRARGRVAAAEAVLTIARSSLLLGAAGDDLVGLSQRIDFAVSKACEEPRQGN